MVLNKLNNILDCRVDIVGMNRPGIYFLFDDTKKLIYIGESKFPLIRILDHFHKHYKIKKTGSRSGYQQKGIGPIFTYFRTMHVQSEDSRIRQHYEKRWIRKYDPPLNYNTRAENYDLTWREINGFVYVYDSFFYQDMSWHRYLHDEVMSKRRSFVESKKN
jgi:hypothetical protein